MTGTYLPAESVSAVPETAAVSAGIPAAVVSSGAFTRLSDVESGAATEVAAGAAGRSAGPSDKRRIGAGTQDGEDNHGENGCRGQQSDDALNHAAPPPQALLRQAVPPPVLPRRRPLRPLPSESWDVPILRSRARSPRLRDRCSGNSRCLRARCSGRCRLWSCASISCRERRCRRSAGATPLRRRSG